MTKQSSCSTRRREGVRWRSRASTDTRTSPSSSPTTERVRLFLAINLDHQLRQEVHDATAPLREALPGAKWVAAPRLHLTLKFLGEQPEERAMALADVMTMVAARHRELAI